MSHFILQFFVFEIPCLKIFLFSPEGLETRVLPLLEGNKEGSKTNTLSQSRVNVKNMNS